MNFDNILHDAFVFTEHGEAILWSRAAKCPCVNVSANGTDANRALLTCQGCFGAGVIYDDPVPMTAILTGVRNEKQLIEAGVLSPGDMVMGCAPDESNFVSDGDRIQTTWPLGQPYEGELVTRGDLEDDRLFYIPIQVIECFAIDPSTGVKTNYVQGADFTISGRFVTWTASIAQGTVYSLKYTCNFDWIAFSAPSDRYDHGINIGQKMYLRKRHLVFDHP